MKKFKRGVTFVVILFILIGLSGCKFGAVIDVKEPFTYSFTGFNGLALINYNVRTDVFKDYFDYNDQNNLAFFDSIDYTADRGHALSNGDEVTITVTYDTTLAAKAGIRIKNDTFKVPVSGLPELAKDANLLKDQFEHLKAENMDYLMQTLDSSSGIFRPFSATGNARISSDSVRYLGSSLIYTENPADSKACGSNFVSLYSSKITTEDSRYDGKYCYMAIWIPQSASSGEFETDDLYLGDNFGVKLAYTIDERVIGSSLFSYNSSSAKLAEEKGKMPDDQLLIDIISHLYEKDFKQYSVFSGDRASTFSSQELSDLFKSMTAEQQTLSQDIKFEVGQECVTLTELTKRPKEVLGEWITGWDSIEKGTAVTILELYRLPKYSQEYGNIYGRVGDDEWILLEDTEKYLAVPKTVHESLLQKNDYLYKDKEGPSIHDYPTDDDEAEYLESIAEPETDADGNLVGPYTTYVCVNDSMFSRSFSKPNMYGGTETRNEYHVGSEVKVYEEKAVKYQGVYGRIGKDEWVLLGGGHDGDYWIKKE